MNAPHFFNYRLSNTVQDHKPILPVLTMCAGIMKTEVFNSGIRFSIPTRGYKPLDLGNRIDLEQFHFCQVWRQFIEETTLLLPGKADKKKAQKIDEYRDKIPLAWRFYQRQIEKGTDPRKAELKAVKRFYPGDKNSSLL